MLRRSVQALEALVEQQQPAMLLVRRSATASARSPTRALPSAFFSPAISVSAPAARQFSTSSSPRIASQFSSRIASSFRAQSRRTFHSSRARRSHDGHKSDGAKTGSAGESANEYLSLSQRLKKLSREYGWAAVGIYLGLSALDFPFCFLLVRWLGTDRIAAAEHFVVSHVKAVIPDSVKEYWTSYRKELKDVQRDSGNETADPEPVEGWGVKEAEERVQKEASLATQLALAYAIHKSFIFVRVPLTAAVTPKVVKVLRAWGWKIGKPKSA
ncbi:peptide alpha-n-acetyltransferase [Ophiostoma piceae UAMH 11346]|uniref:Peptide alpha-n-acetyltransferase n=1 Tax=Ophiostoma piceae (strain UAMH 11346) TaxID=1262450 RepID=S3BS71_OPHP1|nr:peptide alpha-n-acetyltransferase [Ophiostoma piceae UAMH 11346]